MGFNKKFAIFLAIIIFCFSIKGFGSEPGSKGSAFLRIPLGARASAMGEAFTPFANDVSAVYWNPAGLTQLQRMQFAFSHSEWFCDLRHDFLGYSLPINYNQTLALSFSALYANDFEGRIAPTKDFEEFSSMQGFGGLSYSMRLSDYFRAGLTVKGIYQSIDEESAFSAAVDVGFLYHIPNSQIQLALVARHLGMGVKFVDETSDLPITLGGGLAWQFFNGNLTTVMQGEMVMDHDPTFAFGVEATPIEVFKVRAGYNYNSDREEQGGIAGFTAGFGFNVRDLCVDYAFVPFGDLGDTHRFGITFDFGTPKQLVRKPVQKKPQIEKVEVEKEEPVVVKIQKPQKPKKPEWEVFSHPAVLPVDKKPPAMPTRMNISPKSVKIHTTATDVVDVETEPVETVETPSTPEVIEMPVPSTQIEFEDVEPEDVETLTASELAKKHYDIAVQYRLNGKFEKAKQHYLKAIEYDPFLPAPHADLGWIYLREGMIEEARIEFRKAQELGQVQEINK